MPREHVVTLPELSTPLLTAVFVAVQRCATAVVDGLGAQGSWVAENNIVSQAVPHVHVHVVPRTKGDGLRGFFWPRQKYADDDEIAEYADSPPSRAADVTRARRGAWRGSLGFVGGLDRFADFGEPVTPVAADRLDRS